MVWRDLLTDYLSFYAATLRPYRRVAPIVAGALERAGTNRIVDLCSGAGRPVLSLMSEIRGCGLSRLEVVLTDKYPNLAAWRDIQTSEGDSVSFEATPVDAVDVPRRLAGFRTLFTSFHHFAPDSARLVLSDAVNSGQGIGIFEYTERSWWIWGIPILLIPLFVWISTPFIRPFSWRRLLWTYLLPVGTGGGPVGRLRFLSSELLGRGASWSCRGEGQRGLPLGDRPRAVQRSQPCHLPGWPTPPYRRDEASSGTGCCRERRGRRQLTTVRPTP